MYKSAIEFMVNAQINMVAITEILVIGGKKRSA